LVFGAVDVEFYFEEVLEADGSEAEFPDHVVFFLFEKGSIVSQRLHVANRVKVACLGAECEIASSSEKFGVELGGETIGCIAKFRVRLSKAAANFKRFSEFRL
jgi:hypothetical protein